MLVCETVTGTSMSELIGRRDAAVRADLVELRFDGVAEIDVKAALDGRRTPVVVTCRPEWEGGHYRGPEATRLGMLNDAIAAGAEFVDVEWRADRAALAGGSRIVLSFHDAAGVPQDLTRTVDAMREAGADVVKVAVTAARLSDCVDLRAAMPRRGADQIVIAMGRAGLVTRLCPWLFGSCWTYAGAAAPGQLPADELRDGYRVGETSPRARLFGVVGTWEAARALSAAHNAEFRRRGLDALSVPLAASDARDLAEAVRAFAVAGVSDAGAALGAPDVRAHAARDVDRWIGE